MLDYRICGGSRERVFIGILKVPIHLLFKNCPFFLGHFVIVVLVVASVVGAAWSGLCGIIQFDSRHFDSVVESVEIYQVS